MRIPFKEEGFGVPELLLHYQAAQMVDMIHMLNGTQPKDWVKLESDCVPLNALRIVMG